MNQADTAIYIFACNFTKLDTVSTVDIEEKVNDLIREFAIDMFTQDKGNIVGLYTGGADAKFSHRKFFAIRFLLFYTKRVIQYCYPQFIINIYDPSGWRV